MNMFVLDKEIFMRLAFFVGIFSFMTSWEIISPRRILAKSKSTRWLNNLLITLLNSFIVRWVFPVTAVGLAIISTERHWGAFAITNMSGWIAGILAIVLFDLAIYIQHFLFHKVPFFWRFHRMHHTDLDIDVTTGARFHPFEIIISMGVKMVTVVLLGAPPWSVLAFEVLLNSTSMFNHSNIFVNLRIDRILRLLVVTPDMHRVHHSVIIDETDSNFGFNLPWWDRLFGTYRAQPASGHDGMIIGLSNYRDLKWLTLPWMLAVPFSGRSR
jgi:sterol desaturase/sphingolipid hydroxylase (fatty acid hydroxylase superfamily)